MIYSGTDLLRTNADRQERLDRLQVAKEVQPAEKPAETKSSLDEETQGALLRFARFINKEKKDGRKPKSQSKTPSPVHPYTKSMATLNRAMDSGLTVDIYV